MKDIDYEDILAQVKRMREREGLPTAGEADVQAYEELDQRHAKAPKSDRNAAARPPFEKERNYFLGVAPPERTTEAPPQSEQAAPPLEQERPAAPYIPSAAQDYAPASRREPTENPRYETGPAQKERLPQQGQHLAPAQSTQAQNGYRQPEQSYRPERYAKVAPPAAQGSRASAQSERGAAYTPPREQIVFGGQSPRSYAPPRENPESYAKPQAEYPPPRENPESYVKPQAEYPPPRENPESYVNPQAEYPPPSRAAYDAPPSAQQAYNEQRERYYAPQQPQQQSATRAPQAYPYPQKRAEYPAASRPPYPYEQREQYPQEPDLPSYERYAQEESYAYPPPKAQYAKAPGQYQPQPQYPAAQRQRPYRQQAPQYAPPPYQQGGYERPESYEPPQSYRQPAYAQGEPYREQEPYRPEHPESYESYEHAAAQPYREQEPYGYENNSYPPEAYLEPASSHMGLARQGAPEYSQAPGGQPYAAPPGFIQQPGGYDRGGAPATRENGRQDFYAPLTPQQSPRLQRRAAQLPQQRGGPPMPPDLSRGAPLSRRTLKPVLDDLMQNFGEGVGLGKGIDAMPPVQQRRSVPITGATTAEIAAGSEISALGQAMGQVFERTYDANQSADAAPGEPGGFTFSFSQMTGEFSKPTAFDTLTQQFFSTAAEATGQVAQAQALPAAEMQQPIPEQAAPEQATLAAPPPELPTAPQAEPHTEPSALHEESAAPRMAVGRVPLNPEDTQDDIDYDEQGSVIDASTGEQERRAVLDDIRRVRTGLQVRFVLTGAAFIGLLYLAFSIYFDLPLPPFMFPEDNARAFLIVNAAVLAVAMLINSSIIGGGLVSLFTLKADNDSLISLAAIAAVAQAVSLIATPEAFAEPGVQLYCCVPVLGLWFNVVGKMMLMKRVSKNSHVVCGESQKYVLRTIKSEDFSRELSRGLPADLPEITYSVGTKYVAGFLKASYAPDYSEGINRVLAVIILAASVIVSVAAYFINGSAYVSLTVLSGLLTICAPLTSAIVGNLPMLRAAKKLKKLGAAIVGYPVVEEYSSVRAVTFKAKELFPPESITLSSMKVFQESLIEQAISDACSVISATDSPLAPLFRGMVESQKILKQAENIVFEDSMGLSAWVDGKRVLIGNARLMQNHGVSVPNREYEERYLGDGQQVLYLSNSGELIAMFSFQYTSDSRVMAQLSQLGAQGVSLIVHTTDPNVTPQRLASMFSYPSQLIKVVPASLYADYDKITAPRNRVRATVVYTGSIMSMFRALGLIPRIKTAVTLGAACQLIATLIGYAVLTFFAFFAGMEHVPFTVLLLYQIIWAAVTLAISNLRKI